MPILSGTGALPLPDGSPTRALGPILGLCATVVFLICFLAGDRGPGLAYAVVTLAAPFAIAGGRFRRYGLCDALGLFCLAFAAYNGLMLLRFMTMADLTDIPYPWPFSQDTYIQTGLLNAIAAVTIFCTASIAARIWPTTRPKTFSWPAQMDPSSYATWLYAGLIMYTVGIGMYFLFYDQVGGYLYALKLGRVNRFDVFNTANPGISWPYQAFVVPGLAAIWFVTAQQPNAARKWVSWLAITFWCGVLLLQGDRLPTVQACLTVVAVSFLSRRKKLTLTAKRAVLLACAFVVFATYGHLRALIAPLAAGEMSNADAEAYVDSRSMLDWAKIEHTEFAGPYFSLLQIVSTPNEPYSAGNSYAESLLAVVPKFMYPGTKPTELAQRFAASIQSGHGAAAGWGFSPVAEAYLNFGTAGVIFIFVIMTLFFYTIPQLQYIGVPGLLFSTAILSETIDINRMDFRNVYGTVVYFALGTLLTSLISKGLSGISGVNNRARPLTWSSASDAGRQ